MSFFEFVIALFKVGRDFWQMFRLRIGIVSWGISTCSPTTGVEGVTQLPIFTLFIQALVIINPQNIKF